MKILLLLFHTRKIDVTCYRWNCHGETQWLFCFQQQLSWGWCCAFQEHTWVLSRHGAHLFDKSPFGPGPRFAVCISKQLACAEVTWLSPSCLLLYCYWAALTAFRPCPVLGLRLRKVLGTALRSSLDTNEEFQTVPPAKKADFPSNCLPYSKNTISSPSKQSLQKEN